jgi:acetylornithine deacetylase/succinyl-diaminopimelate desuccinylase-like protein
MLLDHLHRIAVVDQEARRAAVFEILDEMEASYTIHRETVPIREAQNMVVSFHEETTSRLVIGAHYDSVPGSTGANDNAAGVCVLLALLRRFLDTPPAVPVDILFLLWKNRGSEAAAPIYNEAIRSVSGHL